MGLTRSSAAFLRDTNTSTNLTSGTQHYNRSFCSLILRALGLPNLLPRADLSVALASEMVSGHELADSFLSCIF